MFGKIFTVAAVAGLGLALGNAPARAEENFGSPELIAAAKAEGKLIYYTANFAEVEQQVIKEFNKRFPEIKVEMVRAPGGQLITRVKTEAAAGKLIADVVDHSGDDVPVHSQSSLFSFIRCERRCPGQHLSTASWRRR